MKTFVSTSNQESLSLAVTLTSTAIGIILAETYTKKGFMQKQQMIILWNLPLHIVWYVVMVFIANIQGNEYIGIYSF